MPARGGFSGAIEESEKAQLWLGAGVEAAPYQKVAWCRISAVETDISAARNLTVIGFAASGERNR